MEQLLCSTDDASKMLGVSRTTLRGLLEAGTIPTVTIGDRRLVVVQSIRDYVEQLATQSAQAGYVPAKSHRGRPRSVKVS